MSLKYSNPNRPLIFFLSFFLSFFVSSPFLSFLFTDVVLTMDAVQYFFLQIFKVTSIWPGHLFTISSLALKSSLYHSKSPDNPTQRLFIRHLDESTWLSFKDCLTGGYSTVNAKFAFADFGYIDTSSSDTGQDPVITNIPRTIRFSKTLDANRCLLAIRSNLNYIYVLKPGKTRPYTQLPTVACEWTVTTIKRIKQALGQEQLFLNYL